MKKNSTAADVASEFLSNNPSEMLPHDLQKTIRDSAAMASMYMANLVMGGFNREEALTLTCTWIKAILEINKK